MSTPVKDKITYIFNKYFYDFIEDIIRTCPSLVDDVSKACKVRNLQSSKNIVRFANEINTSEVFDKFCEVGEEDLVSYDVVQNIKLVKEVTVGQVITSDNNASDRSKVGSYLYILALFANLYGVDDEDEQVGLFEVYVNAIKAIQQDEEVDLEGVYDKQIHRILENIQSVQRKSNTLGVEDDGENSGDGGLDPDVLKSAEDMLHNSKIGSLAQEISKEIDLSKLNVEKPEDIMNFGNLFGGGGGAGNGGNAALGDIIGKVSSKIHEKINKGEIKHEELMSEAFGMINMLNKGGGANNPFANNPMMQQMMKMMSNKGASGFATNNEKSRASDKREKLRKKLEERTHK